MGEEYIEGGGRGGDVERGDWSRNAAAEFTETKIGDFFVWVRITFKWEQPT